MKADNIKLGDIVYFENPFESNPIIFEGIVVENVLAKDGILDIHNGIYIEYKESNGKKYHWYIEHMYKDKEELVEILKEKYENKMINAYTEFLDCQCKYKKFCEKYTGTK
jgi:hypothetical protein